MSLADRGENVPVRVSECRCVGTPHEGDEIYLLPRLTFEGGAAAMAALTSSMGSPTMDRVLGIAYLTYQTAGWNVIDENGPVPFDLEAVLSDWEVARPVAEKADELYSEGLLRPLVKAVAESSRNGQTATSTSARKSTSTRARKR